MERPRLFGSEEGGVRRLSLVRLSSEIARSVGALGRVEVEGEVVLPKRHPGGTYFTLRDRAAQVSVRCPASRAGRCRVVAGERVLVTASVSWLPERGQLHLLAEEVAPVGAGAIAAAIAERRARLVAEGLLDRRRRPIPRLPAVIGVVCGAEAAVRDDIDSVVAARFPGYPLAYEVTSVSGAGAAEAVIEAVRVLDARPEVEVIVLARGGGDAAQLLPFSDEALCRAIATTATPVVSAIGHDGDRPLCDEVADVRFGTPSLAATALVPDRRALETDLERLMTLARTTVERRVASSLQRLDAVDRDAALRSGLELASRRLAQASARLEVLHPARRLTDQHERLAALGRHLEALSPARVLERGYAVVRRGDGSVLRNAADAPPGTGVDIELAAGRLAARVEQVRA